MKRGNEFKVGLAVLAAIAVVVIGALWLSQADINQQTVTHTARFRTVGGLGVGAPVTLRGVRIGRVEAIRLVGDGWVETELSIDRRVQLPRKPAVVAAPASLFGEWGADVVSFDPLPVDPNLRDALVESDRSSRDGAWPGATLPDIGELTAQASRIAGGVGDITARVSQAFDSAALQDMQKSIQNLAVISKRLVSFADAQTTRIDSISDNVASTSSSFAQMARMFGTAAARLDTATADQQLQSIVNNSRESSADLRQAAADLRSLAAVARAQEVTLIRILQAADSMVQRVQAGRGTLGMLTADSTLYLETTKTMIQFRELLTDIQANPRKYFKVSVF